MNELVIIILGSVCGILTALIINIKKTNHDQPALIYELRKKIEEYERLGIITSEEKEQLLSLYKGRSPSEYINIVHKLDSPSIKEDIAGLGQRLEEIKRKLDTLSIKELSIVLDQKMAEIISKLDKIDRDKNDHVKSQAKIEKIDKDKKEVRELDDDYNVLEDIKKRIVDTLSKLEKTELE